MTAQIQTPISEEHVAFRLDDLFTVEALAARSGGRLTVATIRWQLRHRDENGLSACVVRIGKRDHLHLPRYERWLASRAGLQA